jgi:NlpC/P60 family putative phage cell wall peptidase
MDHATLTGGAIVQVARSWLGTPYRHQASLKGVGADCLGLVRGVWREAIGPEPQALPPYTPSWAEAGAGEMLADAGFRFLVPQSGRAFRPGDVLLFRWRAGYAAKHAGIASAGDHMIHAQDGACVSEVPLEGWWLRHLAFVFRFPGVNA